MATTVGLTRKKENRKITVSSGSAALRMKNQKNYNFPEKLEHFTENYVKAWTVKQC